MSDLRLCVRCVMDTSDPQIEFDENGICNHCREAEAALDRLSKDKGPETLARMVDEIRHAGSGKPYDCIIGLSGGADSSFLTYEMKRLGLRPLVIHLDNGWDSELAVKNIENIVRKLELDLYTHVVDWKEFRDIQLSYFAASVIDIEMITDHAIVALAYEQALKNGVRYILTGVNTATESILPSAWVHPKTDLRNLRAIHKTFGVVPLKTLPTASTLRIRYLQRFRGIHSINLLDLIDYDKAAAMRTLEEEVGWTNYGGKHHESMFTRFYQQCILPVKFGVDKRRAHLSSLICAGQISRDDALRELATSPVDSSTLEADKTYVAKKLGKSVEWMDQYLAQPSRSHYEFASDQTYLKGLSKIKQAIKRKGRRQIPAHPETDN